MSDFIPVTDKDFLVWAKNFIAYASENLTTLNLVPADMAVLTNALTAFENDYDQNQSGTKNNIFEETGVKNDARLEFEKAILFLTEQLSEDSNITNEQKAALGLLTLEQIQVTASHTPTSRPVLRIDSTQSLKHILYWRDENALNSIAMPLGIIGCEIWMKVDGDTPVDESECFFISLAISTPYIETFKTEDVGKTAYYLLRWVNDDDKKGSWSNVESATILGE